MAKCRVLIEGAASGVWTPHDRRFLVAWNPHVRFGTLAVDSTSDPREAKVFEDVSDALREWRTVSDVQRWRPDGQPNRPLLALSLTFEEVKEELPDDK